MRELVQVTTEFMKTVHEVLVKADDTLDSTDEFQQTCTQFTKYVLHRYNNFRFVEPACWRAASCQVFWPISKG